MREKAATRQVLDAVEHAAATHGLGRLRSVHVATSVSSLRQGGSVAAIALGVAMGGVYVLSYGSIFSWLSWWQSLIIPVIGLIWVVVGCWTLFAPLFQPRPAIYLHEAGLLYVNNEIEAILWRKVERVWRVNRRALSRAGRIYYVVRRSDGLLFEIGPYLLNIEVLAEALVQEVTHHLLPRALAAYARGEVVPFEEVALSGQGVIVREGRKRLDWSELAGLTINEKQLVWYKRGDEQAWAAVPLGLVPNVEVLRGLVAYVQRMQKREMLPRIVAYRAGATIDFGALSINQQGVGLGGSAELIPWSAIASIGVDDTQIIVGRKDSGQWYTFPNWMVRDTEALKELVEYIVGGGAW
jgi:hypothetical protein